MGLSGRKVKQRIGKDPRNLSWADDASRFGQAYLEKFGWDSSKGLGVSGEGRTSALNATQKLDMLGIGMQHQKDPNGIAWRQNRDFENLLRRLNSGETTETLGPFHKAREAGEEEEAVADDANGEGATKKEKGKGKKKRKVLEEEEEEEEGLLDDKKQRKKRRRKLRDGDDGDAVEGHVAPAPDEPDASESRVAPAAAATATATATAPVLRAPPRTHRARIIAAKRMAASNSAALAEILGIPASSSSSSTPTPSAFTTISPSPLCTTPTPTPTPTTTMTEAQEPLQKLTTATQSVGDYFKAKLAAKAQQPRSDLAPVAAIAAPLNDDDDDDDDRPLRAGLGVSRLVPNETPSDERKRGGIGASSKFAAMFALGRATSDTGDGNVASVDVDVTRGADGCDCGKSERKRAKEERRKAKEERRRKRAEARSGTAAGSLDSEAADVPVGETLGGGAKRKKRRELGAPESPLEGGMEDIPTKKRKKQDKDRKSRKDRDPEE